MFNNKRLKLDLCLPVYNEEAILSANIKRIIDFLTERDRGIDCRVIILINGSIDQSAIIAQQLAQQWPSLIDFVNYSIIGKSRTLIAYADSSQADWWGFMDIDLATDLRNLDDFFNLIINQSADLLIASRLIVGSSCSRSWTRKLISIVYNRLTHFYLKTGVKDHQCGCKFISQSWWRTLRPYLQDSRWFLDTEMIAWTNKLGGKTIEVPVDWTDNRYQFRPTKIKLFRDIIDFLINLYLLRRRLNANNFK